jgi:hypothetical protein
MCPPDSLGCHGATGLGVLPAFGNVGFEAEAMTTPDLVPCWRFAYDGLAGYISGGHEHGVELTTGADVQPVTRPMCLNLEHYHARSHADGLFVPRYKAPVQAEQVAEDSVRVAIGPNDRWQVRATITYRLLPHRVIRARYDFLFDADFPGFEAFVSNYFHSPTEPYLHLGDGWQQPTIRESEHRFWARGPSEAENVRALYPDSFQPVHLTAVVDPAPYKYPIVVTPIADSGWSVITLVDRSGCPNLSANRRWNAHDFALVGRDVARGESITCRASLAYARLESLDQALTLFQKLAKVDPY